MEADGYDVVVVGGGAAGLAAALGAAEAARAAGARISIGLLERADEAEAGGNTRWSPAYMRLESPQRLAPRFVDDMLDLSRQRSDPRYVARLAAEATATLAWIEGHGVSFHTPATYFLTSAAPRIQPVGGGASLVRELSAAAAAAGAELRYRTAAQRIVVGADGRLAGVDVQRADGSLQTLACGALILACGGFETDPALMARTFGPGAEAMRPISPGTRFNRGDGIRMALALGAQASGDWNGLHAEPVDPRATKAEAVVLVYPYGVLVNQRGQRFVDEGSGRVDETWEIFARQIFFEQPGRIAYVILDQRLVEIANYERAIRSDVEPLRAETLGGLAAAIGVDAPALRATIEAYNAAAPGDESAFDATRVDGLRTRDGYVPPKSNWARRIDRPPYLAYPVVCAIAYTFGGVATNEQAEVLGADGAPIAGLYAAGEITGLYYGKAPGGTSVLRGLVFGRIAGGRAVAFVHASRSNPRVPHALG
jgi:tricarballylate dehydrogenase